VWASLNLKNPSGYKTLFLYSNLCISVRLDSPSCSFTSIFFLTTFCIYKWLFSCLTSIVHYCSRIVITRTSLLAISNVDKTLKPMGGKLDCHRKKKIYRIGSETFAFQWTTNDNPIHTCSLETEVNCVMLARGVAFFIHETLIYVPSYGRIVY